MSRKLSILLTAEAIQALDELAVRWGCRSQTATVEFLIRRAANLPPFERPGDGDQAERARNLILFADEEPEPEPEPDEKPVQTETYNAPAPEEAFPVEQPQEPVEPAPPVPAPEPPPAPVAPPPRPPGEARVFVRSWYDDGAPEWVQILGADATSGLDLTPEQMAALNDWQAGVDREAP